MPHSTLVNAYGMTEFGGSVVMVDPADDDDVRLGTQGPPFPGLEVGIRDSSGQAIPPGGRGEIVIRGLASFKVPRHVRFVTEWPMSSTKVQTFRLCEQLEAELAARRVP
jgi:non-ribosomal peptide synthetase component E (peptide arylation enzyme)